MDVFLGQDPLGLLAQGILGNALGRPWSGQSTWSSLIRSLFNRISLNSGRMVLKSADMMRGAASIHHIPIWARA